MHICPTSEDATYIVSGQGPVATSKIRTRDIFPSCPDFLTLSDRHRGFSILYQKQLFFEFFVVDRG
jgi:hypothetical protein